MQCAKNFRYFSAQYAKTQFVIMSDINNPHDVKAKTTIL